MIWHEEVHSNSRTVQRLCAGASFRHIRGIRALRKCIGEWRKKTSSSVLRAVINDVNRVLWKHRREERRL